MLGQRASVDSLNARNFIALEIVLKRFRAAPIARDGAEFFNDKTAHMRRFTLVVVLIDPIVSDERIGHGDDLAAIGRICENLLITCHGGIKTNLASASSLGSKGFTFKITSVFQCENGFHELATLALLAEEPGRKERLHSDSGRCRSGCRKAPVST